MEQKEIQWFVPWWTVRKSGDSIRPRASCLLPSQIFQTGNPGYPLAPVEKLLEWKEFEIILAIFSCPLLFLFEQSPVLLPSVQFCWSCSQWLGPYEVQLPVFEEFVYFLPALRSWRYLSLCRWLRKTQPTSDTLLYKSAVEMEMPAVPLAEVLVAFAVINGLILVALKSMILICAISLLLICWRTKLCNANGNKVLYKPLHMNPGACLCNRTSV